MQPAGASALRNAGLCGGWGVAALISNQLGSRRENHGGARRTDGRKLGYHVPRAADGRFGSSAAAFALTGTARDMTSAGIIPERPSLVPALRGELRAARMDCPRVV